MFRYMTGSNDHFIVSCRSNGNLLQQTFFAEVLGDGLDAGSSFSNLHVPFLGKRRARLLRFLIDVTEATRFALGIVIVGSAFEPNEPFDLIDGPTQTSLFDHFPRHGLGSAGGEVEKGAEARESDVVVDLCTR